jgi:RimJ/RimL family protein N-acetyltransferase
MNSESFIDFPLLTKSLSRRSSERIALRALSHCDMWPLWQATRNEAFNRFLTWSQPDDEAELQRRVDTLLTCAEQGRGSFLSVVIKDTGEWASLFRFGPPTPELNKPRSVEAGIWTHPKFWAAGLSAEMSRLMLEGVFQHSKAESLVAQGEVSNKAVLRLFETCGLAFSSHRKHRFEDGLERDMAVYELTREAWQAQREG